MSKLDMRRKFSFILVGKTGHGKSATGNSMLMKKVFNVSASTKSVTKEVNDNYAKIDDDVIHVVDGPGLSDTDSKLPSEDRKRAVDDMSKALALCNGQVDAFLLVIKFGERLTNEMVAALNTLCQIFGPKYFNHVIVVISFGDLFQDLFNDGEIIEPFDHWCRREYSNMYEVCHGRFVLFNNREKIEASRRNQIRQIITLTESFGSSYTWKVFEEAKKGRDRMIEELKMSILQEGIQESICLLHGQILKFADQPTYEGRKYIQMFVQNVLLKVESADKGTGRLDEIKNVVRKCNNNLEDLAKLKTVAEELESVRQKNSKWTRQKNVFTIAACVIGSILLAPVALAVALPVGVVGAVVVAGAGVVSLAHSGYKAITDDSDCNETDTQE